MKVKVAIFVTKKNGTNMIEGEEAINEVSKEVSVYVRKLKMRKNER